MGQDKSSARGGKSRDDSKTLDASGVVRSDVGGVATNTSVPPQLPIVVPGSTPNLAPGASAPVTGLPPSAASGQETATTTKSDKKRAAMDARDAASTEAAAAIAADSVHEEERRKAQRRPAGPARQAIAANDDIPTIGALIYALEQKPSKTPFNFAAIASGVWVLLGLMFGYGMLAPVAQKAASIGEILSQPVLMTVLATVLIPPVLFFFLAMLVWRAQELRLMSSAMTEVAVRLAEPDRAAEQSVASLGQSVRKQIGFMNDAVSQAIGRAGELEAMVHNEVASLERSFQDNETRIRGLLTELSSERTQLVSTSGQVHQTLRSMSDEVPALIEKLTSQQSKLARIIEGAGQNLIALEGSLTTASDKLETSLGDRTGHLQEVLTEYATAINSSLGSRTEQIQSVFEEYTRALDMSLMVRSEEMGRSLALRSEALDAALIERTAALDGAFGERLRLFDERKAFLDGAFEERLQNFDQSILRSTHAIDGVIGEKAQALSIAMDSHARQLAETLGRQSVDLDETLMHGIDAVRKTSQSITTQSVKAIEGLSNQADMLKNVSENLLMQIGNVTNRFETQGQSIMRAANALETANFRIDSTLQTRHRELNDTLGKLSHKAGEFDDAIRTYSTTLEGSYTDAQMRARALTSELTTNATQHAQSALSDIERIKRETEAHAQQSFSSLRTQMSDVGREMQSHMGSLTSRLQETSNDLRSRSQMAADEMAAEQVRLQAEAERIPQVTRESADVMRRALNEQLRALDKLSTLTTREAARRDISPPMPAAPQQTQAQLPRPGYAGPPPTLSQSFVAEASRVTPQQPTPTPLQPAGLQPAPVAAPPVQSSGWSVGDLLARASTDTDAPRSAPTQRHSEQSGQNAGAPINLEVISGALDADTTAAIWSRFRAGQRGIMVRSIYSPEGRTMFDEVSRRYQVEPPFKSTVDRFLMDFERVLREAENRDPSGRMADGHLVSPSGRVYLFLAHASGRLV
ncbi:MAG: hypothetical protein ABL898_14075 [Hyphomicrobiaceae bacterium]